MHLRLFFFCFFSLFIIKICSNSFFYIVLYLRKTKQPLFVFFINSEKQPNFSVSVQLLKQFAASKCIKPILVNHAYRVPASDPMENIGNWCSHYPSGMVSKYFAPGLALGPGFLCPIQIKKPPTSLPAAS